MCGFVGCISQERILDQVCEAATLLRHRGPDDHAHYATHHNGWQIALAHQRLSIIDLDRRSRQPLSNEDEQIWVIYNGEIYNYRSLRSELQTHGHRFKTASDTEVLVHAYEQWGDTFLSRLRGMFAFVLVISRTCGSSWGGITLASSHYTTRSSRTAE